MITRHHLTIVCVIIFIILIVARVAISARTRRSPARAKYRAVAALDDPNARQQFTRATDRAAHVARRGVSPALDADTLFTRATLYMREYDDLHDKIASARQPRALIQLERRAASISQLARDTIRAAIEARTRENRSANHDGEIALGEQLFDDNAIERRATEINADVAPPRVALPPMPRVTRAARAPLDTALVASPKWAPDPENVHDSTVGDSVSRRLDYMRHNDLRVFRENECIGAIAFLLRGRDPVTCERVVRTLERARVGGVCERYNIRELDALRLVLERAYHARSDSAARNLNDALIGALADCAEGDSGTVCQVGRISRYVASLDIVDEVLPAPAIKPTDAYRAEIFARLGTIQARNGEVTSAEASALIDEYRAQLPARVLKKIRDECMGAL
ncbi:MAG: hypothetical protein M0R66_03510 [Candidatus Omnitrophica bacterium]|nr:hypothetical protein [Candidatus Omnitrophota bacterium]